MASNNEAIGEISAREIALASLAADLAYSNTVPAGVAKLERNPVFGSIVHRNEINERNTRTLSISDPGGCHERIACIETSDAVFIAFRGNFPSARGGLDLAQGMRFLTELGSNMSSTRLEAPWFMPEVEGALLHGVYIAAVTDLVFRNELQQCLRRANGKTVVFCGHSRGGALATSLFYFGLCTGFDGDWRELKCITFGCPPIGNVEVAEWLISSMANSRLLNVCMASDLVVFLGTPAVRSCIERVRSQATNRRQLLDALSALLGCPGEGFAAAGMWVMLFPIQNSSNEDDEYKLFEVFGVQEPPIGVEELASDVFRRLEDQLSRSTVEDVVQWFQSRQPLVPHELATLCQHLPHYLRPDLREFQRQLSLNYFELLGFTDSTQYAHISSHEVRRRFRIESRKYHPNSARVLRMGDDPAAAKMLSELWLRLEKAKSVLEDPDQRAEYIRKLQEGQQQRERTRASWYNGRRNLSPELLRQRQCGRVAELAVKNAPKKLLTWQQNTPAAATNAAATVQQQAASQQSAVNHLFSSKANLVRVSRQFGDARKIVFVRPENMVATDVAAPTKAFTDAQKAAASTKTAGTNMSTVNSAVGKAEASAGFFSKSALKNAAKGAAIAAAIGAAIGAGLELWQQFSAGGRVEIARKLESCVLHRMPLGVLQRLCRACNITVEAGAWAHKARLQSAVCRHFALDRIRCNALLDAGKAGLNGAVDAFVSLVGGDVVKAVFSSDDKGKSEEEKRLNNQRRWVSGTTSAAAAAVGIAAMFNPVGAAIAIGIPVGAALIQLAHTYFTKDKLHAATAERSMGELFDRMHAVYHRRAISDGQLYTITSGEGAAEVREVHIDVAEVVVRNGLERLEEADGHAVHDDVIAELRRMGGREGFVRREQFVRAVMTHWRSGQATAEVRRRNITSAREQQRCQALLEDRSATALLEDGSATALLTDAAADSVDELADVEFDCWSAFVVLLGLHRQQYDASERQQVEALELVMNDYGLPPDEVADDGSIYGESRGISLGNAVSSLLPDVANEMDQQFVCSITDQSQLQRLLLDRDTVPNASASASGASTERFVSALQEQLMESIGMPYTPLAQRAAPLLEGEAHELHERVIENLLAMLTDSAADE